MEQVAAPVWLSLYELIIYAHSRPLSPNLTEVMELVTRGKMDEVEKFLQEAPDAPDMPCRAQLVRDEEANKPLVTKAPEVL